MGKYRVRALLAAVVLGAGIVAGPVAEANATPDCPPAPAEAI